MIPDPRIAALHASALRLRKPTHVLAGALCIAVRVPGRVWRSLCPWCAEAATGYETSEECQALGLPLGGECDRCPYVGPDVCVVACLTD